MKNNKCCQGGYNSNDDFKKVVNFLKIVNEPNRLKILCFLRHGERCVCEIWKNLELSQNLTSHHLKVLKDFGLIESKHDHEEGRKIIYSSNNEVIQQYTSLLNNFLISNL